MKILFAVSNDNITTSVVNKYQQKYKEIITNKNVYYFNAIIKELQKNKNYDAIVIGEDLEPVSNNNYEAIDKFLFEKLDSISDEAAKPTGEDIPIILICSDRRSQADGLLIKLFGIGIYNAIIGNDRSIDTVCNLINKPRNKKEAKIYYKVESDEITPYERGNDSDVSETEIQNILAHYRKIGSNPQKCVQSFDSIAEQYNETQLRIIIKFLPKEVKAILETNSTKYQKLVNNGTVLSNGKYVEYQNKQGDNKKEKMDILTKDLKKTNLSRPVIIPSTMNIGKKDENNAPSVNQNTNMNQNINQGEKRMNNNLNNNTNQNFNTNNMNRPMQNNPFNNQNPYYMNNGMPNANYNAQRPIPNNMNNNMQRPMQNNMNNGVQRPVQNNMNNARPPVQSNIFEPITTNNINPNTQNQGLNMNQMSMENNEIKPMENNVIKPVEELPQMENTLFNEIPSMNENAQAYTTETVPVNDDMMASTEIPPVKRGRGRPRKNPDAVVPKAVVQYDEFGNPIKRGRGRPRKQQVEAQSNNNTSVAIPETNTSVMVPDNNTSIAVPESNTDILPYENNDIFGKASTVQDNNIFGDNDIFGANPIQDTMPGFDNDIFSNNEVLESDEESVLPGFGLDNDLENLFSLDSTSEPALTKEENNVMPGFESNTNTTSDELFSSPYKAQDDIFSVPTESLMNTNNKETNVSTNIVTGNGKLVSFVGTSKNGTSFIVNNIAQMLSASNVKTAILDLTQNKNSYYMFTNNDQNLMQIAVNSIRELAAQKVNGVNVNRNLSVFTSLPDEKLDVDINNVMQTLSNNFDVILIDCDFDTEVECFKNSNETYLIQSMDTFTIQPLTKFLSDLKLKNALDESKLRVVINKYVRLKKLNEKMIIGGMSKYNEPSMTLQRDLFNSQTIKYTTIPFEVEAYAKYLENIAMCELNLNGYSQNLMNSLEGLKSMVYPLIYGGNRQTSSVKPAYTEEKRGLFGNKKQGAEPQGVQFTSNINDTLNKMRSNNF